MFQDILDKYTQDFDSDFLEHFACVIRNKYITYSNPLDSVRDLYSDIIEEFCLEDLVIELDKKFTFEIVSGDLVQNENLRVWK